MASRPIDEKIVAMKMDNSDFKRKAMETTGLFAKFKQALANVPTGNLSKVSGEFGNIQKAANRTDLSGLSTAIETINSRFSTMGVVATTALMNITNQAVYAGQNMLKSLSTDQIMDGFREYELKMGSIQTILANTQNKGSTLEDVKRNFEELNRYADKTIYSFADMTKNIGLFTNAGLGLDESTKMIKGFSNAAAASGAGSMEAARAAYQLSQGLASGYIMTIDWMSLTNAGMGNDNMKRDLIAIGQAMGKLGKGAKNSEHVIKNWKETLSDDKWLTADVMSVYLQAMAGDLDKATLMSKGLTEAQADLLVQNAKTGEDAATKVRTFTQMMSALKEGIGSGWAETWEIVFGDFEQATKFWSSISGFITPFFDKQAETRNKTLRAIFRREGDGIGNIFKGVTNILKPIGQLFGSIGSGFRKAFPRPSVSVITRMIDSFADFTETLAFSEKTVKNLEMVFAGFFSIFAIGWKIIKGAAMVLLTLIPSFEGVAAKVVELIAKVAKIPKGFNDATSSTDTFNAALGVLKKVADGVASVLENVVGSMITFASAVETAWYIFAKGDYRSGGPWEEDEYIIDKMFDIREAVIAAVGAIKEVWSIFTKGDFIGTGPWEEDSKIVDWMFDIREGSIALGDAIASIRISSIADGFVDFFKYIKGGFDWVVEKLTAVGTAIKNALPSGNELFAGGFIAGMIGIVGMALKMAWDLYQVFTGWGQIGDGVQEVLEGVGGALNAFSMQVYANSLLTIAFAIGVLAVAFWGMSKLNHEQIATGLYAIIGSLMALVGAMKIMQMYDIKGTGMQAMGQIVALAIAFGILSLALRSLSGLDWNEISKGVFGLAVTMRVFAGSISVMTKFGGAKVAASSAQLIAMAGSMYILALVLKKIGDMDWEKLKQGMLGLSVTLGIFAIAVTVMSKFGSGQIAASALQFVAIAGSVLILVEAIRQIAEIPPEDLKTGLATIGYILTAIALLGAITKNANVLGMGAGIFLLAGALTLLMVPIATLGHMDLKTLGKGIGAIAVALVAIGAASMLMTGMIAAGAGLILIAAALHLLIVPITMFGKIGWKTIQEGAIGLAFALGLLGLTAGILGLAWAPIMLFSAAIAVLGIGLMAAGVGISLFSTSLVALAAMTGSAVVTIVAFLGTLIVGLASLIPKAVEFVWFLMQSMAEAFRDNAPKLVDTMYDGIIKVLNVISENIPKFVEAGVKIITNFLDALAENLPKIVQSAADLMVAFIESLAAAVELNGPKFIDAWMRLMAQVTILMVQAGVAVVQALFGWIPGVTDATNKIGETAETKIKEAFDAKGVGDSKGKDFSNALASKAGDANNAGDKVGASAESGADSADLWKIGGGHGSDFAGALASAAPSARTSGLNLGNAGKDGAGSIDLSSTGENFGLGFAGGIDSDSVLGKVVSAGKAIARAAKNAVANWLDMHSPSRLMFKDGRFFTEGFALGIADKAKMVGDKAKSIAMTAKDALNQFIDGFELPDNELHFKAVIDYESLDTNRFGNVSSLSVRPDTSLTNGLISATRAERMRSMTSEVSVNTSNNEKEAQTVDKTPAIIQIVTPERREFARWLVDDVTDLQELKMATFDQF